MNVLEVRRGNRGRKNKRGTRHVGRELAFELRLVRDTGRGTNNQLQPNATKRLVNEISIASASREAVAFRLKTIFQ